jgi:hypothetical protein
MRAAVVLAVLLVLGGVLRRVTVPWNAAEAQAPVPGGAVAGEDPRRDGGAREAQPAGGSVSVEGTASVPVDLTFSGSVKRAQLLHLGKSVWSADAPPVSQKLVLQIPFPAEGIELGVRVEWAGSGAQALRVRLSAPDGAELDRTAWGEGVMEAVLPFP